MPEDQYPTEKELQTIKDWPYEKGYVDLLAFVKSCWAYANWGWSGPSKKYNYYISTAGWSGNEAIIESLTCNHMFWACCFKEHRCGGHYKLYIPKCLRRPINAKVG